MFKEVKDTFIENLGSESQLNNDLRRAFIAIAVNGEYNFYHYWWSFWSVDDCNKRKLIDKYREIEYLINSEFKDYVKELILNLKGKNLVELATDFIPPIDFPNWKQKLIKEKELLDNNGSNYIAVPADNSYCYILKGKRPRDKKRMFQN